MTTANQILNQLGGNKFLAMTDATYYFDNNTLVAKFKGSSVANIMYVTLNEKDLYNVKFSKSRGINFKDIVEQNDIAVDMLNQFFTKTTGLKTSL